MTERKDAPLLGAREQRMLGYIKERLTAPEIGRREGLQADYALKERNRIAQKHGVKVSKDTKSPSIPYGLDQESFIFRQRLSNKLWHLVNRAGLSQLEVAQKVGVPRKLQAKAMNNKAPIYNWSLTEIQQLAKALGVPFKELMKDALEESQNGTY